MISVFWLKDRNIRNCIRQADVVRPKVQKFSCCDKTVIIRMFAASDVETETLACQSAVRSLEAHVLRILQLRGVIDVGRTNRMLFWQLCWQKLFALEHKIYRSPTMWIVRKKRLPSCKLDAMNSGIILSPHSMREMRDISQELSGCKWKEALMTPL